jgi:hypothetical protein
MKTFIKDTFMSFYLYIHAYNSNNLALKQLFIFYLNKFDMLFFDIKKFYILKIF